MSNLNLRRKQLEKIQDLGYYTLIWICEEVQCCEGEKKKQKGLFFIGEVLDVTGHLGGYNFQWAWSSAYAAAQYV